MMRQSFNTTTHYGYINTTQPINNGRYQDQVNYLSHYEGSESSCEDHRQYKLFIGGIPPDTNKSNHQSSYQRPCFPSRTFCRDIAFLWGFESPARKLLKFRPIWLISSPKPIF